MVADRGYFEGEQLRACDEAGIITFVPKPLRPGTKGKGRFGKQDFVYLADEDAYRCPAGEKLTRRGSSVHNGKMAACLRNESLRGLCSERKMHARHKTAG